MQDDTKLAHLGRHPERHSGAINTPVYHVSTVRYPTVGAMRDAIKNRWNTLFYGRHGSPTTFDFEAAVAEMEGGFKGVITPSGVSAVTTALSAFAKNGDHVLVTDNAYDPTRHFCDQVLRRNGVDVSYFDPLIGGDIGRLMQPNTSAVMLESPGSLTFEMQDIPAIAAVAHDGGAVVINDNTWGTPLFFKSFEHGVDVSVHSVSKYIGGHSDLMLGIAVTTEATYLPVKRTAALYGVCAGPDDAYLALRGLRTLGARLRQHRESARIVGDWLETRPEVSRLLDPTREGDPGHEIWRRDFTGGASLFSMVLDRPYGDDAVAAMLDDLRVFAMGFSWGGYESLILPVDPRPDRTATTWTAEGPVIRLYIGLEDPQDLIADLEAGFERLTAAAGG